MTPVLQIRLLGRFQLVYDQQPLPTVKSTRLQSLLAYLVLHAGAFHSRQYLAFLLWPASTEEQARTNLRKLCFQLRQALPTSDLFLRMDQHTIQWQPDAPYTLDVDEVRHLLNRQVQMPSLPENLIDLVDLYAGELLPSCYDEWLLPLRQQLHDSVLSDLNRLVTLLEQQRAYQEGIRYARRLLQFDPLQEHTYQRLIRLHLLDGDRSSALRTYQECLKVLKRELGVEPDEETQGLHHQIISGHFAERQAESVRNHPPDESTPIPTTLGHNLHWSRPAFLVEQELAHAPTTPPFVARQRELAQLHGFLANALQGRGQIVFVSGDAGAGKSALVKEFVRRAQETHPDLVVASGACHTHAGIGDPYLPFREVLNVLTGDVETHYASGTMTGENARRLWSLTPLSVACLVDDAPNLIDTFVPGQRLLDRLANFAPAPAWLPRLAQLCAQPTSTDLLQTRLFAQYTSVLQRLATYQPVVIVLEDLHWADASSISLLFHLGCSLQASRILLLGTYRAEEVALEGTSHPLEEVVDECRRRYGEIRVQLNEISAQEGRQFVDALLDTAPNQLNASFRQALVRHTGGHALFTVELLRHLQDGGGLVQDQVGRWIEGDAVRWTHLPAKAEGVIEKRIHRLADEVRELLVVASVEGESFTADVVARVQDRSLRAILRQFAHLESRHHLVVAQEEIKVTDRYLARYRFTHALFQHYLYHTLSPGERRLLHGEIAKALEALYGEELVAITPQLAYHYAQAGAEEKAVTYLTQAGDWARRLSASQEALHYYQQALTLTEGKATFDLILARRAQVLLDLFQGHAAARDYEQLLVNAQQRVNRQQELEGLIGLAQAYYVVSLDELDSDVITRVGPLRDAAYALARQLNDKRAMVRALLVARWLVDSGQSSREQALAQVEEAVALSQEVGNEQLILESNTSLIFALRLLERYPEAEAQGEALLNRPEAQRNLPLRKEIYYELIWVHYFQGNYGRCIVCCDGAIQIAHEIGAPPVQYPTTKALSLLWLGRYEEAWLALQQEVVDESHHLGIAFQELGIGIYYLELLEYSKASAIFEHIIHQARRLRRVWMENWAMGLLAKAKIRSGRFEPSDLAGMSHDLAQVAIVSVESMIAALAAVMVGEIALTAGQLEDALQHAEMFAARAQRLGLRHDTLRAVELQIRVLLQMDQAEVALRLADTSISSAERMSYSPLVWQLRVRKAQALARLGENAAARLEYQAAAVVIKQLSATIGNVELQRGFLADPLVASILAATQIDTNPTLPLPFG
ncbi:MAG: AAA family ATPase [Caldilineaceae bacterium]